MQPSPSSPSFYYPTSPVSSTQGLYDSAYVSYVYSSPVPTTSFHFTSCPYSNDTFYPSQTYPSYYSPMTYPTQQTYMTSTPLPASNVCNVPVTQNLQPKRRRPQQPLNSSPAICPARKRISDEAIDRLNAFYAMKKRPTEAEKDRLAMECNITVAQVNTWFNNARSRRGDTNPKLTQKLLKQQINSLHNQVAYLQQQQQPTSSAEDFSF